MAAIIELNLPDALARALGGNTAELPRRTLEAATLQQYAAGKITHAEVAEILGISRWETDALLKAKNVFPAGFDQEFENDLKELRRAIGE
jgi:hypothetical protein